MYKYVQLHDGIVVGTSSLAEPVILENLIFIDDVEQEVGIGYLYEERTHTFIAPDPQPKPEPKASVEEISEETLLETKYQTSLLEMMI